MLKRKITTDIEQFFTNSPSKALLITGARQVGKTYTIRQFARKQDVSNIF